MKKSYLLILSFLFLTLTVGKVTNATPSYKSGYYYTYAICACKLEGDEQLEKHLFISNVIWIDDYKWDKVEGAFFSESNQNHDYTEGPIKKKPEARRKRHAMVNDYKKDNYVMHYVNLISD